MIVMNKYVITNQSDYWDLMLYKIMDNHSFNDVMKFHQSSTMVKNGSSISPYNQEVLQWLNQVENTDIVPNFFELEVHLPPVSKINHQGSIRSFKLNEPLGLSLLSQILHLSFGRSAESTSKRYPSGGGLYPVFPVLVILEGYNSDYPRGSYIYDNKHNSIKLIKQWSDEDFETLQGTINSWERRMYSNYFIAYAIDIPRAIAKYKRRGYRHALIEVGTMAQSLRESILDLNQSLGDLCWSGFDDNALTYLLGLNPRICPVALIQWFGRMS